MPPETAWRGPAHASPPGPLLPAVPFCGEEAGAGRLGTVVCTRPPGWGYATLCRLSSRCWDHAWAGGTPAVLSAHPPARPALGALQPCCLPAHPMLEVLCLPDVLELGACRGASSHRGQGCALVGGGAEGAGPQALTHCLCSCLIAIKSCQKQNRYSCTHYAPTATFAK